MITIRQMDESELDRIGEIDRTEYVTTGYVMRDGRAVAEEVDWQVPPWTAEPGPHSVPGHVDGVRRTMAHGGVMLGAFDGNRLVGFAALRHRLTPGMAQLAGMWVSNGYRRQGIATRLTDEVFRLARERGAERIYVSGTPSESAVGFYTSRGFRVTDEPHPDLLAEEPEDIHMTKPL